MAPLKVDFPTKHYHSVDDLETILKAALVGPDATDLNKMIELLNKMLLNPTSTCIDASQNDDGQLNTLFEMLNRLKDNHQEDDTSRFISTKLHEMKTAQPEAKRVQVFRDLLKYLCNLAENHETVFREFKSRLHKLDGPKDPLQHSADQGQIAP